MNETIIHFLQGQTCATICCVDELDKPYCFSCFFASNSEEVLLYFKSSADSHHSVLMKKNPFIAGTILPDKLNMLVVKGLQFEGILLDAHHPFTEKASGYYHKKHLMALAIPGEIWTIQINCIKMTDSTKGFGKKITWNREGNGQLAIGNKQ
jgi:uncharacterized protein